VWIVCLNYGDLIDLLTKAQCMRALPSSAVMIISVPFCC